jgi:ABC-2 type transport system ATP-binding protein
MTAAPRSDSARVGTTEAASAMAVRFAGVEKRYGATQALVGLTLDVQRGEMFGLIGPDGAGKTTAIRLMCGLLRPDAGEVRVLGHDPVREHTRITHRVGYLSQRFSLYGDLSIDENIAFFAEVHGVRRYQERRTQLLDMTQLTPFRARLASRLSGGMKQKLALACTLIHEPDLILLDEPTTGVDPVSRREFWKLLSEFLDRGMTIVMSTPYLDEAERCTRVALVHEGRALAVDPPDRLRRLMRGRLVEVMLPGVADAAEIAQRLPGVKSAHVFGERLHVTLEDESDAALERFCAAAHGTPIGTASIRPVEPSLEDVFIAQLTGQEVGRG